MEILAREKAEKLLNKDHARRKMRQLQVRQQSSEWMERSRVRYLEERQRQIDLITQQLAQEAQGKAINDIEIMERMHDLCAEEVGAAHRAAANLPDFDFLQSNKNQENLDRAKRRGAQALAQEKLSMHNVFKANHEAKIFRENVRRDEDTRLKEFVSRTRVTRSQAAVDRIVDKLTSKRSEKKRRTDYQPGLAKTLRVPKLSHSDAKISKSKHSKTVKKAKDVAYYDSAIPQGSLKYPPPPGLVEKHSKTSTAGNAFDHAKRIVKEQRKKQVKQKVQEAEKVKEAERRGKTAMKVAKLQRQLEDIQNEFIASGFHVDPKLNDSFLGLSEDEEGDEDYDEEDFAVSITSVGEISNREDTTSPNAPKGHTLKAKTSKKKLPTKKSQGKEEIAGASPKLESKSNKSPKSPRKEGPTSPKSPKKSQPASTTAKPSTKDKSIQEKSFTSPVTKTTVPPPPASPVGESLPEKAHYGSEKSPVYPSNQTSPNVSQRGSARTSTTPADKIQPGTSAKLPDSVKDKQSDGKRASLAGKDRRDVVGEVITGDESEPLIIPSDERRSANSQQQDDKPRLISTKTALRQQQLKSGGSLSSPVASKEFATGQITDKEALDPLESKEKGNAIQEKQQDRLPPAKQENSGSSLHTLSSIGSREDVFNKQITDHQSPPDNSQEFPLTSTPAQEVKTSKNTSINSSTFHTTGTMSPRTIRKRRKALRYYIQKLLEMRPESINNLPAGSVQSINSYVEIPSSAVSSLVSSEILSENRTTSPETGGETTDHSYGSYDPRYGSHKYASLNRYHFGNTTSTNGTSDHYNTLSSVTEEEEEEEGMTSEGPSAEPDTNITSSSSGETLARVTVALSPRSNNDST